MSIHVGVHRQHNPAVAARSADAWSPPAVIPSVPAAEPQAIPTEPGSTSSPDAPSGQAELERATRFGHSFARIAVHAPPQRTGDASGDSFPIARVAASEERAGGPVGNASDPDVQLLAVIEAFENVRSLGEQVVGSPENQEAETGESPDTADVVRQGQRHLESVNAGLAQLRAVAAGRDAALKRRVLSAFTRPMIEQADQQIMSGEGTQGTAATIREQQPVAPAAKSLKVAPRSDPAEAEADHVASVIAGGGHIAVQYRAGSGTVHRQVAEALMGAGAALLTVDAEAAPVEATSGPPGWLAGATLAVVGLALLGTGYLLRGKSRSKSRAAPRAATKDAAQDRGSINLMRFQVQWNSSGNGPTFSQVATAPAATGVTTEKATAALAVAVSTVTPASARTAAAVAEAAQQRWILSRPPAGIAIGGYSKSEYFSYQNYTDARVDVENIRGHNLRT